MFLEIRDDGKDHPCQGNVYGFAFAIQPWSQLLGMFGAGTATAGRVVADGTARLAIPRLIERDHAKLRGRIDDLTSHRSIPTRLMNSEGPRRAVRPQTEKGPASVLQNVANPPPESWRFADTRAEMRDSFSEGKVVYGQGRAERGLSFVVSVLSADRKLRENFDEPSFRAGKPRFAGNSYLSSIGSSCGYGGSAEGGALRKVVCGKPNGTEDWMRLHSGTTRWHDVWMVLT